LAPIEVFFGAIVLMFALIGVARGFLRELGVTTVLMFLLFFLSQFEPQLDKGMARLMSTNVVPAAERDLWQCVLFVFVVAAVAFVSYQGETLSFSGQAPQGAQGVVLGLVTGLLNGYLIAGSIWFYMHKFDYPIEVLGFSTAALSELAQGLIAYLPMTFLGQPVLFGQSLLLYLSMLLIIARVAR
jgi:uncharacterized membrane protein required for colicin V production